MLWVIPNPEVTSILQSEIGRLAKLHQTTSFLPHITAARLPVKTPDETETIKTVDKVSQRIQNHSISIGEIKLSSKPYQKMVIALGDSLFFSELGMAIDSAFQEPCSKKEFHCSLMYGYTSNDVLGNEKQKVLDRLPEEWFAHELAVVLLNGGPDEWKIVHQKKLM
ncbi:MAG: hypothetical protein WD381_01655 [Balneolaceae bacterium]